MEYLTIFYERAGFIGLLIATNSMGIHLLGEDSLGIQLGVVLSGIIVGVFALGPVMKFVFNSPEMHIWHHAYEIPKDKPHRINFGLTLAIWDYLFGTAHIPYEGRDIKLGFPGVEEFPEGFIGQNKHGF